MSENINLFYVTEKSNNHEIVYFDLFEISQGGPEVGKLKINDAIIEGFFGGPCIIKNDTLFLTSWIRCWFVNKFKITIINLKTLEIKRLGNCKNLIFLDNIDEDIIYFYEDLNKEKILCLKYHKF